MHNLTLAASLGTLRRVAVVLALLLLIQGCTNSKLIIGPLYNRLDDRMRSQFEEFGEFNDEQKAAFEQRLGTYHVWHRQSELPQYAQLMSNIASSISVANTTQDDVQRWFDTASVHSLLARECHPVNFSFDLIRSLTDEQLNSIEQQLKDERQENRDERADRTPQQRVERRLGNIIKWAGRINLELTTAQQALLRSAFEQQVSLSKEYYALTDNWRQDFFVLARNRENPEFNSTMSDHMKTLWPILENSYPDQWQQNQDLWKDTSLRMVDSMTSTQRRTLSKWLGKMADTLLAISKDKPSFQHVNDASLGCTIGNG